MSKTSGGTDVSQVVGDPEEQPPGRFIAGHAQDRDPVGMDQPPGAMELYKVEVEVCPRCGGAMSIVAFITEPAVVRRMLAHLDHRRIEARAGPWAGAAAGQAPEGGSSS